VKKEARSLGKEARSLGKEARSQKPEARMWGRLLAMLALTSGFWLLASGFLPQKTLKVDVNLVNIFATVKDDAGGFVTDLNRDDFRVYEDDQPQDIQIFEKQDRVDSSVGILMDTSGSMVDILPVMRKAVPEFTSSMLKRDEFFIVSFGTSVKLVHRSSQSKKHFDDSLHQMRAYGSSVLYDALLYSLGRVEASDHPRKALIVFTDGNDNGSNVGHGRVVEEAQQSAVLLYFVAIGARVLVDSHTLESLSDMTGGRTLYVGKQEAVQPVLDQIRTELAHQYYLGYYMQRRPGYHRLRVEVPGRNVRIRAKAGYIGG